MDDATIKAAARDYVEQVIRAGDQDRETIPAEAVERAVEVAASSAKELHEAVELAQESHEARDAPTA